MVSSVQRLDRAAAVELAARGALRRERDDLAGGEAALAQLAQHDGADGARGADDGDAVAAHRAPAPAPNGCSAPMSSAPSSNASCSARTAPATCSAVTTQEILIGEVEIISMLIPSSPSVEKTLAATPGCDLIPAADDGHLAHLGVLGRSADAELGDHGLERVARARAGRRAGR